MREPRRSADRFRFLATYVAGRALATSEAPAGVAAHTDGNCVFVTTDAAPEQQRRELLLQCALLHAGSLDRERVKSLRGRPQVARRYLALEGRRAWAELSQRIPLSESDSPGPATTASADESLKLARRNTPVGDPPEWFGVIRPSRLLAAPESAGARASNKDLKLDFDPTETPESESDGDQEQEPESKLLRLFDNPLFNSQALSDQFRKIFNSTRSAGERSPPGELQVRAIRRVQSRSASARPVPTPIHFRDDAAPSAAVGVGGAWYPEWDVHAQRYRPDWCRVVDFPLRTAADVAGAGVHRDEVLRRRLSRVGLGPQVLRRRPDGDELDIEALIDLFVDMRSGFAPPENVYQERRKLARNLGVLILVDASGSASDTDPTGLAVHEHQRRAAATMAATLEELGDRVAVYSFSSQGRRAVQLAAIKPFGQRFGAGGRARLNQLQPSGYTRLGAGIRGAGEILKEEAGTPNRLLLVLSDGFPYDDGYEGRYAEADAHKALEELRGDGVACLCLSIGADTQPEALRRVFGAASHANAPTLGELSPRMDQLFLSALKELAAPKPRDAHRLHRA